MYAQTGANANTNYQQANESASGTNSQQDEPDIQDADFEEVH